MMTRRQWGPPIAVGLLAFLATATSLGHDFTFDDGYVIRTNSHVHALQNIWGLFGQTYWPKELGGDGYRPLVTSLFTVQWVVGSGAPWVFHLVNVLLAIATSLAVGWCAAAVLPAGAAWTAAALFAVHPVHVEVTGNVVGQSELLVALVLSLAIGIYLRARRNGWPRPRDIAAVFGLYIVGLLSKEHAIVLPALLLAAECTVIDTPDWRARLSRGRLLALMFVAVSLAYLFVRGLILGDLAGFAPCAAFRYLQMGAADRVATMMTEMPRVARLLVFPTRLSGEYSPPDVTMAHGFAADQLPGMFLCAAVPLLALAVRRKWPVASFGLLWIVIAFLPVSNLLVPAGFIVAERTLFLPSIGIVLAAGAMLAPVLKSGRATERRLVALAVVVLVALGLGRSVDRQRVWKNDSVFFDALVKDAPMGYRSHVLLARAVGMQGRYREMEQEYKRAIALFPYDVSMMLSIANDYYRAGFCAPAATLLKWSYSREPLVPDGRVQYVQCLRRLGRWNDARTAAIDALSVVPPLQISGLRRSIARADSALGRRRNQ
jgi:hypothetical protein